VHGANRLASNSLLEGIVFGGRAGRAMREWAEGRQVGRGTPPPPDGTLASAGELRTLAWEKCGILRDGDGLRSACDWLDARESKMATAVENAETRNMHRVISLIARCALAREESRGAHYRSDFPEKRKAFEKHSLAERGHEVDWY
jgi:L-aspartate oxidase